MFSPGISEDLNFSPSLFISRCCAMFKASRSNLKSFMALTVILQTLMNLGGLF